MSAFCGLLLVSRRRKGKQLGGARRARKRYASHNVIMAEPGRGRFAIPRTFVACAPRIIDVDEKTRKISLTSNTDFRLEFLENFRAVNCRKPTQ